MQYNETRLTAASVIRAAQIDVEIERYVYAHPEIFGADPAEGSGARGIKLRKYCSDSVLYALHAEYDALPRESVTTEVNEPDMSASNDFYGVKEDAPAKTEAPSPAAPIKKKKTAESYRESVTNGLNKVQHNQIGLTSFTNAVFTVFAQLDNEDQAKLRWIIKEHPAGEKVLKDLARVHKI